MTEGKEIRVERDSMGELRVPVDAYYGAQTMRGRPQFPDQQPQVPTLVHPGNRPYQARRSRS